MFKVVWEPAVFRLEQLEILDSLHCLLFTDSVHVGEWDEECFLDIYQFFFTNYRLQNMHLYNNVHSNT